MKKIIYSFAIISTLIFSANVLANDSSQKNYLENKSNNYDAQFLDTMIAHRRQGIEMFGLAIQKSYSSQVKSKAQAMLNYYEKDISELESLRSKVKSNESKNFDKNFPDLKNIDMDDLISESGEDFDEEFLDEDIKHRKEAVKLCKEAVKKAKHPDVKSKAFRIIDEENKEISELKEISKTID